MASVFSSGEIVTSFDPAIVVTRVRAPVSIDMV
jgi:hypothetical protein